MVIGVLCIAAVGAQAKSARVCYIKQARVHNGIPLIHMLSSRGASCSDALKIQIAYAKMVNEGWCDLRSGCIAGFKPRQGWGCTATNKWRLVQGKKHFGTSYYCWRGAHREYASELFAFWDTSSKKLNNLPRQRSAAWDVRHNQL